MPLGFHPLSDSKTHLSHSAILPLFYYSSIMHYFLIEVLIQMKSNKEGHGYLSPMFESQSSSNLVPKISVDKARQRASLTRGSHPQWGQVESSDLSEEH